MSGHVHVSERKSCLVYFKQYGEKYTTIIRHISEKDTIETSIIVGYTSSVAYITGKGEL